ncbi:MAG: hypothetical protein N3A71_00070 [Candidatus Dojkabacteria bacterium]|nr:hypothetical protein [Candidatus Dojkabacteria bacterium]
MLKFISLITNKIQNNKTKKNKIPSNKKNVTKNKLSPKKSNNVLNKPLNSKLFRLILISIIILLFIGFIGLNTYVDAYAKTYIRIYYKTQKISINRVLSFNINDNKLKTTELTLEDAFDLEYNATGEKIKGSKATGKVAIFNSTDKEIRLPINTKIKCVSSLCAGLEYILLSEVKVSGFSSQGEIKIEASEISEKYNIPAGARFSVGSYDHINEVFLTNTTSITGGTKAEKVKIITQQDIENALKNIEESLKTQILTKIKTNKNYTNTYLIAENTFRLEIIDSNINKKAEDESETFNIRMNAKGIIKAFEKNQFNDIKNDLIKQRLPKSYIWDGNKENFIVNVVGSETDSVAIEFRINGIAQPQIDKKQIANRIKSKNINEAKEVLDKLEYLERYEIDLEVSNLPFWFHRISNDEKNIIIVIIPIE